MPEGPEIKASADSLNTLVKEIKTITVKHKLKLPVNVKSVTSKGKKIIFSLDDDNFLVSYLGLQGQWSVNKTDHTRVTIIHQDGKVYYNDPINGGGFDIVYGQAQLSARLKDVGPDLLNGEVSFKDWMAVVTKPKLQDWQVCKFLMEQKHFSGVGNYVKAEALYRAAIRPDALLSELTEKDHKYLYYGVVDVLQESYKAQGASIRTYLSISGDKGGFVTEVYNQKKCPEGHKVITTMFKDGRVSHWVPEHQVIPNKWEGIPRFSKTKLELAQGGNKAGYDVTDLKTYCHEYGLSVQGTKKDLVKRLIEYKK